MVMTNAEKQARFRKKEELNKHVQQVARDCRFLMGSKLYLQRTLGDVDRRLQEAAALPNGWTEEDLDLAYERIRNIYGDAAGAVDLVSEDVKAAKDSVDPFIESAAPQKWLEDQQQEQRDTIALADHLISALQLSGRSNEMQAAAVAETLRHVGRALGNSAAVGRSNATAVCLSAVNRHYARPEWFIEEMVSWMGRNLDPDLRTRLGTRLIENAKGNRP